MTANAMVPQRGFQWSDGQHFGWTADYGIQGLGATNGGKYPDIKFSDVEKPEINEGQHYYRASVTGDIEVAGWRFVGTANCCHAQSVNGGTISPWNGFYFSYDVNCGNMHPPSYHAYCKTCGYDITNFNVYISTDSARTITSIPVPSSYAFVCAFCKSLEQGVTINEHYCIAVSNNKFQIKYHENEGSGRTLNSEHIYGNTGIYEGKEYAALKSLKTVTSNEIYREGYELIGWNTKEDGSGTHFDNGELLTTEKIKNTPEFKEVLSNFELEIRNQQAPKIEITLYAEWKISNATLEIDMNGGAYNGLDMYNRTQNYGTDLSIKTEYISTPNPYKCEFYNGDTLVQTIENTVSFDYFEKIYPFKGILETSDTGYTYYYKSKNLFEAFDGAFDGNVDGIKAQYKYTDIILPKTEKEGVYFNGWYLDKECTQYVGNEGDKIPLTGDTKLYAGFADLTIEAKENFIANDGKGAADLVWYGAGLSDKFFKVYKSEENGEYINILSEEAENQSAVDKTFTSNTTYTIPQSGLYQIDVAGQKGENYGNYVGGNGGFVSGQVYLNQGEKINIKVNEGGGTGSDFGDGGGLSSVYLNRVDATPFLIAGGGGGATSQFDGEVGGADFSLTNSSKGENGYAGGGAGYYGGTSGSIITHQHTDDCYVLNKTGYNAFTLTDINGNYYQSSNIRTLEKNEIYNISHSNRESYENPIPVNKITSPSEKVYIPTLGFDTMIITVQGTARDQFWDPYVSIKIFNQNEEIIYYSTTDNLTSNNDYLS